MTEPQREMYRREQSARLAMATRACEAERITARLRRWTSITLVLTNVTLLVLLLGGQPWNY